MPIYAYRCSTCGHAKDVLQKMSDAVLTVCPECGNATFVKQLTAAGFQLKGSGWYVTDFRGGDNKPEAKPAEGATPDAAKGSTEAQPTAAVPAGAGASKGESSSAPVPGPAPAAAPAPAAPKTDSK